MVYILNFCNFNGLKCNDESVSTYEALKVSGVITDNCDVISRSTTPDISHIDNNVEKGLKITYSKGDECLNAFGNKLINICLYRYGLFIW